MFNNIYFEDVFSGDLIILNTSSVDVFDENNLTSESNIAVSNQVVNENVQSTNSEILPSQNFIDCETIQLIQKIADDNNLSKNRPERESDDFTIWRRRLVRAVGQYLIENSPNQIPSKQHKQKYAKALVDSFPCLRNENTPNGFVKINFPFFFSI